MTRINSFPPIINDHSKILILGSVPGIKSLEKQQYYAHPQNKFWKIIFEILEEPFTTDYDEKIKLLKSRGVAVWDVIDSCEREGSLDTKIRNEEHNDILMLLKNHPSINAIFCNGQKSYKNIQKVFAGESEIPIFALPSTSPAYTIKYEQKLEHWQIIKTYL